MDNNLKQNTWKFHKDDYKNEDYSLKEIFEIDLPFWECKQNVVVEKDVEIDRFSQIILDLIDNGFSYYSDIYKFLGIDETSFVNIQFHFLLKNGFIAENDDGSLKVTLEGRNFKNKKRNAKKMETEEFEFLMFDRFNFIKNDMNGEFFDPQKPIDKVSAGRMQEFFGYKLIQTHKKETEDEIITIDHVHEPSYRDLQDNRSDFSTFLNSQFKNKTFYDFADTDLKRYKRNIRFVALLYVHNFNQMDIKVDLRQYNLSVNKFNRKFIKEEKLSKIVTSYFQKNLSKIEKFLTPPEPKKVRIKLGTSKDIKRSLKEL